MLSFNYLLVLPNDKRIRRILGVKKRQYQEQMADINSSQPGPLVGRVLGNYLYRLIRVIIINRLLRDGWVEIHDVQIDLIRGGYLTNDQEAIFFGAVGVIIDYVVFNGVHLIGGKGLPDVK